MISFFKGVLIGMANLIPGVSGGTFALLMGIYTRLMESLSSLDLSFLKGVFSGRIKSEVERVDGIFLFQIFIGAVLGIAVFSWPADYFISRFPGLTLAFFSGLILPSIRVPARMIGRRSSGVYLAAIAGAAAVILLSLYGRPFQGTRGHLYVFLSGAAGISAMALPGVSGSSLMVILGIYGRIISNIREFTSTLSLSSFIFLAVFGLGCLAGLLFFVRVMNRLLRRRRDITLSFLTGLVAGSLYLLWPFKDFSAVCAGDALSAARNVIPVSAVEILTRLGAFAAGAGSSLGFERIASEEGKD